MRFRNILILLPLLFFWGCGNETEVAVDNERTAKKAPLTFTVDLPDINGDQDDAIVIPNGRPVYAIFVSGYLRNREFDGLHFYNFAKALQEQGAYIHYAWWNNLLAPYMERPLHDPASDPGNLPAGDWLGLIPGLIGTSIDKANPSEDYQFQADAKALLQAIRANNPHAVIIVVGHSFGGDSVARLGAATNVDIDLLAPIDPVGNRSCTSGNLICNTLDQWTRFRATHEDKFWFPLPREFGTNIKYLYHRWQDEALPPIDFKCPYIPNPADAAPPLCILFSTYLFTHPDSRVTNIHSGSRNVQSVIVTNRYSDPYFPYLFGAIDGHGEIAGYRGLDLAGGESNPLAIRAQNWPKYQSSDSLIIRKQKTAERKKFLQDWETDPESLDNAGLAPINPEYCLVSPDLIEIFQTAINLQPVAVAGEDQIVECASPGGTTVILDGSGTSDPEGDPLTFVWSGTFGSLVGETVTLELPLGDHSITLTVTDDSGKTGSDIVYVSVVDTSAPSMSISLSPVVLWPANHKLIGITASIQAIDSCDASPNVNLVSIISNEVDNGLGDGNSNNDIQGASFATDDRTFLLRAERSGNGNGRVYSITYRVTDASANITDVTTEVTVPHNRD